MGRELLDFDIDPLEHGLDLSRPPGNQSPLYAAYPSLNCRVDVYRIKKRWGYTTYRTLLSNAKCYDIRRFQLDDGTTQDLFLTDANLGKIETASGKTYSYITETGDYDSVIDSITDASNSVVTFKAGETIQADGVVAEDFFILDDDHTSDVEPDTVWMEIKTVDSETQCTLVGNYATLGTTGSWSGSEKSGLVRKVHAIPTNERPAIEVVNKIYVYSTKSINMKQYIGTGYATDLDTTYTNAGIMKSFADRLIVADHKESGTEYRWRLRFCKQGDPTDWTHNTSGYYDLFTSDDYVNALGVVGPHFFVYKRDMFHIGQKTGISTDPLTFPSEKRGIGVYARDSLVHVLNTNAFLWRDDFYIISGGEPVSIGERIRHDFFQLVPEENLPYVWGKHYFRKHEVMWIADTTAGRLAFVWNYKDKEWAIYEFWHSIIGGGSA